MNTKTYGYRVEPGPSLVGILTSACVARCTFDSSVVVLQWLSTAYSQDPGPGMYPVAHIVAEAHRKSNGFSLLGTDDAEELLGGDYSVFDFQAASVCHCS